MSSNPPAYSRQTIALALLCGALPGLFLLITSTTFLVEGQFVYDVKRLLQLGIITALFLAATFNPSLRNAFGAQLARIPKWVKTLLLLIVALGITSSAVNATSNMHLAYSLLEVALLSMLVLAALVIAACRVVAGELFDQVAITLLAMTSIVVGMQELLGVAAALANDTEYFSSISLMHYAYPRFFNQVQAWTLPVLAALPVVWSRTQSDVLRSRVFQTIVCLLAISLNWYVTLVTGGRGVALSLLAAFVLCLLLLPALRKATLRWHLPGFLMALALFLVISQVMANKAEEPDAGATITAQTQKEEGVNPRDHFENIAGQSKFKRQSISGRISLDSSGRLGLWRGSIKDLKANPWLGNGPMNYACTGPMYRSGHPHNFALQIAGEWGVPALLLLAAIGAFIAFRLWALRGLEETFTGHSSMTSLLALGVIAACGYSMLSGVLVMPASQISGVLIAGWLMGTTITTPTTSVAASRAVIATTIAATIISLATLNFSIAEASQREYRETFIPPLDGAIPRYWQHGKMCKYFDQF